MNKSNDSKRFVDPNRTPKGGSPDNYSQKSLPSKQVTSRPLPPPVPAPKSK